MRAKMRVLAGVACVASLTACEAILGVGSLTERAADAGSESPDGAKLDAGSGSGADASRDAHAPDHDAENRDGSQQQHDSATEAATDATLDVSRPDGSEPDAGHDAPIFKVDAPPADGCAEQVASAQGIYVAPAPAGVTTSCGSPNTPCSSIQTALTQAGSVGASVVYVAQGTYTEAIDLPAGIALRGGWIDVGGTWKALCTGSPSASTIVQAPTGSASALTASAGSSSVDTMTIVNQTTATAGQSLYGVIATGASTKLTLSNVILQVGNGGAGLDGTSGSMGAGAVACTTPGNAAAGPVGALGAPGPAGSYSATGFIAGAAAGPGGSGTAGNNGGMGAPGMTATSCGGTCSCQTCGIGDGCNPPVTSCSDVFGSQTVTGSNGSPGCGGNPGGGGAGGAGGGASIALFVWGATVDVNMGAFEPGAGGAGGNGGGGGGGASGVAGAAGIGTCTNQIAGAKSCTTKSTPEGGAGGSAGGAGGAGGIGGAGSGGDSYCYYVGGTGMVSAPDLDCMMGTAGLGGNQTSGTAGLSGAAGIHN